QAKANGAAASKPTLRRSALAARPADSGAVEQEAHPVSPTARGPTQGLSWDFSKVPTFAPDFGSGGDRSADKMATRPDKTAHEVPGDFRGALDPSASADSHGRIVAWVKANQNAGEALAPRFAR